MSDDPWADWYDTYRRQRDSGAAAEAALKRQINWMSWFIIVWTALICGATVFAIWYLMW